jgi:hypothetical protein
MHVYLSNLMEYKTGLVIYSSTDSDTKWPSTSWWMIPIGPAIVNPYEE